MRFCTDEGGVHGWQYFMVLKVDIHNDRMLLGFGKLKTFKQSWMEFHLQHLRTWLQQHSGERNDSIYRTSLFNWDLKDKNENSEFITVRKWINWFKWTWTEWRKCRQIMRVGTGIRYPRLTLKADFCWWDAITMLYDAVMVLRYDLMFLNKQRLDNTRVGKCSNWFTLQGWQKLFGFWRTFQNPGKSILVYQPCCRKNLGKTIFQPCKVLLKQRK